MAQAVAESVETPTGKKTKPVVVCQRLTKVFRDFWLRNRARAVDNIDFHIEPGEIFGLLGPNGSGKSTTIKMMLGLLRPTSGRVAVFGKPPTDVLIKKRIGYLPEESYLYQFLNARETLDYYARLFEIDTRTRSKRVDELLDMVGLSGAQFRPVREYSKGMQRRIGLAQALINDPDFLVLDEPTTGLDPIGTKQVKDLILELGRRGKTVLLSSHLLSDVEDVVDRMVILYGGRIRATGTCDELLEATNRTTIETDALDDATIAQVDELIRARTGGNSGLLRVAHPRQRLEELFLDIVERARAERLETSGATAGGITAAFLSASEAAQIEGDQLIDTLMAEKTPEPTHVEVVEELSVGKQETQDEAATLLENLVNPTEQHPAEPRVEFEDTEHSSSAPSGQVDNVDRSVIDSLLNGGADQNAQEDRR
ncbi:MAG: ABC transporter ATP-binding protein [Phycisphaeraceae bacterium]|nr:ABC transporter ATP-binding protein [Phycisphaerales bacterium]MCB9860348.1 ABC transporter ATP-binding protein [Phycisphaeraceae bacterium]